MDSSSYYTNQMNTSNSPHAMPGVSPHQLQHNSNLPTLPPLQQHAAMHSNLYGGAPHAPRAPINPNTPGSANTLGNYPHMAPQQSRFMMPTNNYQQHPQAYRASTSMLPQSSTAMSQPQAIAPAPAGLRMQQPLRPMPANGMQHMQPSLSPYGQGMMSQPPMMLEEQPTHVVGSQGRRGILPSAPGRPAVTATGTGSAKTAIIPQKDADGKFPCPHCTKTYLHAKHLKRHLLRRKSWKFSDLQTALTSYRYWRPSIHVRAVSGHFLSE